MAKRENIPRVSEEILQHPYVKHLHELIEGLAKDLEKSKERIEELEAEIRRLKKQPKKPKITPSQLDEIQKEEKSKGTGKRAGSEKRSKKKDLAIDEQRKVEAKEVPAGWRLVGYKSYVIQDVKVSRNNICYEREIWESPDGQSRIIASLPGSIAGRGFGEELRRYVIYLYNECHVTQPIIHKHLTNLGIDISKGQINHLLNEDKANKVFEEEILDVVATGIAQSEEIRTDDTGARHKGKNAYCNCINTDLFTYFVTTSSKSRINFLKILQGRNTDYQINEVAIAYCERQGLVPKYMTLISKHAPLILEDEKAFEQFLKTLGITARYAKRTITEGCLVGSLVEHGFDINKVIHSDGAGQFKVFIHALCWKHAERPLKKLHIHNLVQQKQWDQKMQAYWQLYQDLKAYKKASVQQQREQKEKLEKDFDQLCESVENFAALNYVLQALANKEEELLVVLNRPSTSLHNNSSEREIREYAKRRKISGSTRSENGKKSRDIFTSLKKTCQKLGVNFWDYLLDRIKGENKIPPLVDILSDPSHLAVNSIATKG